MSLEEVISIKVTLISTTASTFRNAIAIKSSPLRHTSFWEHLF